MLKLSDAVISAIIKRGIVYEARNTEIEADIPIEGTEIKVIFKCDHMTIQLKKED